MIHCIVFNRWNYLMYPYLNVSSKNPNKYTNYRIFYYSLFLILFWSVLYTFMSRKILIVMKNSIKNFITKS